MTFRLKDNNLSRSSRADRLAAVERIVAELREHREVEADPSLRDYYRAALDRLDAPGFGLQNDTVTALKEIRDSLRKLEGLMTKLEADQPHLIDAAGAAAANAGTAAAGSVLTEIVTRVTKAEARIDGAERRLLSRGE